MQRYWATLVGRRWMRREDGTTDGHSKMTSTTRTWPSELQHTPADTQTPRQTDTRTDGHRDVQTDGQLIGLRPVNVYTRSGVGSSSSSSSNVKPALHPTQHIAKRKHRHHFSIVWFVFYLFLLLWCLHVLQLLNCLARFFFRIFIMCFTASTCVWHASNKLLTYLLTACLSELCSWTLHSNSYIAFIWH